MKVLILVINLLFVFQLQSQNKSCSIVGPQNINIEQVNNYCAYLPNDASNITWTAYGSIEILESQGNCITATSSNCGVGLIEVNYCTGAQDLESLFTGKSCCNRCIIEVYTPISQCCVVDDCAIAEECSITDIGPINPNLPEGTFCVGNLGHVESMSTPGVPIEQMCWVIQAAGQTPGTTLSDFNPFHPSTMPNTSTIVVQSGPILDFSLSGEGSWTVVAQYKDCDGNVTASCGTTIRAVKCDGGFEIDNLNQEIGISNMEEFSIYPNPATLNVNVVISELLNLKDQKVDLEFYNSIGQAVKLVPGIHSYRTEVDISDLDKGIYLVKMYTSDKNEIFVKKINIQ